MSLCLLVSGATPAGRQGRAVEPLDASTPLPYFIADGQGTSGYLATDRELARWALDAWQRSADGAFAFVEAPEREAIVRVYWADPSDGQYGEMIPILVAGRRGGAVFVRPDMAALGDAIERQTFGDRLLRDAIVYLTCVHELGHVLGLPHTRDFRDIMYFFGYGGDVRQYFGRYRAELRARADIATRPGLSAGDVAKLRALYPRR